jgi:hypothetical protein
MESGPTRKIVAISGKLISMVFIFCGGLSHDCNIYDM